jgi:osmotically inducible protein OsmC
MPTRRASAAWEGGLKGGKGSLKTESGAANGAYSFGSRFENGTGTNPEELLAAAYAACFAMALSAGLEKAGKTAKSVKADAAATVEKVGEGFKVTKILLTVMASVPGIANDEFQKIAGATKEACPIGGALKGNVDLALDAKLG